MANGVVAVAEDREELAQRCLDQHQAGDIGEATADPVAGRRQEAEIVAEAFLGIGIDAGIQVGLALRDRVWKTKASISMPAPAMLQAIRAPSTPVARPKAAGRAKMPEPTIDPRPAR